MGDGLLRVKLDFILKVYIFHQICNHVFIDLLRLTLFRMADIFPMQHLFNSFHLIIIIKLTLATSWTTVEFGQDVH